MTSNDGTELKNPWVFTFSGNLITNGQIQTKILETENANEARAFITVMQRALKIFEEPHLIELPQLKYHKQ